MPETKTLDPQFTEGVFKRWILCKDRTYRMDYVIGYAVSNIEDANLEFMKFYVYKTEKGLWIMCDAETGTTIGGELFNMPSKEQAAHKAIDAIRRNKKTAIDYKIAKQKAQNLVCSHGVQNKLPTPTLNELKRNKGIPLTTGENHES